MSILVKAEAILPMLRSLSRDQQVRVLRTLLEWLGLSDPSFILELIDAVPRPMQVNMIRTMIDRLGLTDAHALMPKPLPGPALMEAVSLQWYYYELGLNHAGPNRKEVILLIRNITDLTLNQAVRAVNGATQNEPVVLLPRLGKQAANQLSAEFARLGADCYIKGIL